MKFEFVFFSEGHFREMSGRLQEVGYHHGKAVFHGWSKLESYDAVFLKQKLHSAREKQSRLVRNQLFLTNSIPAFF